MKVDKNANTMHVNSLNSFVPNPLIQVKIEFESDPILNLSWKVQKKKDNVNFSTFVFTGILF